VASVGILGGTFNPPHIGHLVCAQEARAQLGLDRVVLMPVYTPPHKDAIDDPGPQARLALCRAAVAGDEQLELSTLEIDRGGSSYTVDTLRALHGSREGDDLTFIVGGDMASSLPSWREPEALLELARLAVAEREEHRRQEIAERLGALAGADQRVVFFTMPRLDISSSDIRRRVAQGRPVRWLVPGEVAEEIERRGLYGAAAGKAGGTAERSEVVQ
jgi:nicotinate-nucleotide adenylyltransferase